MRRILLASVLLALAAAPAAAQSLQVEIVGARPHMVAFEINDDMLVCGDNQINSTTTAVVWDAGDGATILPGADGISQAGDINAAGDVVGWFHSASDLDTAVVWSAASGYAEWTEIGLPPAVRPDIYLYTQGYAINDLGEVALMAGLEGYATPDRGRIGLTEDPYYWSESGGFVPLPHLSGARNSGVRDINNAGTIAGYSETLSGEVHVVTWSRDGSITDLGLPPGTTGGYATGINEAGTIVGYTERNRDSWVYRPGRGFTILEDFGFNATARDVNNHGIVAGVADVFPFESVPVVWDRAGRIYNVAEAAGYGDYFFTDGVAINDNDEMVVYGINLMTGNRDAVVVRLTFGD